MMFWLLLTGDDMKARLPFDPARYPTKKRSYILANCLNLLMVGLDCFRTPAPQNDKGMSRDECPNLSAVAWQGILMQSVTSIKIRANKIRQRAMPNRNMSTSMASKAKKQAESEQNTPECCRSVQPRRSPADHQNADEAW